MGQMRMHHFEILYIFVAYLREIYLFGQNKFFSKNRAIQRRGKTKADSTVKSGLFVKFLVSKDQKNYTTVFWGRYFNVTQPGGVSFAARVLCFGVKAARGLVTKRVEIHSFTKPRQLRSLIYLVMVTVQKTWKFKLGLLQTEGLSLHLKFDLTNQDSAGRKNSTVLHSMQKANKKKH